MFTTIQAHVFKSGSGACAAFLANYHQKNFAKVSFGNQHYNLPPWSISILPDCKNTVYNTARVRNTCHECSFLCFMSSYGTHFKFLYRLVLKVNRLRWLQFLSMEDSLGKHIPKRHLQILTVHSQCQGCWSRLIQQEMYLITCGTLQSKLLYAHN